MTRRIVAVLVLFKTELHQSSTYISLQEARSRIPDDTLDLLLLVQDNSPARAVPSLLPPNTRYVADPNNSGLASAYNRAWQTAVNEGYDWLLTLDQDTSLPQDTFLHFLRALDVVQTRPEIAAVVPKIMADRKVLSPHYFAAGALPRWFPEDFTGIPAQSVFAFNSGSLLRVASLRQIGGYLPDFWLDSSDLALFQRLNAYGKRVYLLGDLQLQHDFSLFKAQQKISVTRYRALLAAESAFWDLYRSGLGGLERTLRLVGRWIKHLVRQDSRELRILTQQQLASRLFRSRRSRLAQWRRSCVERLRTTHEEPKQAERLKVSVCMAAYRGARHIEAQLNTVIPQLTADDELVIVDDASQDGTWALLLEVQRRVMAQPAAPHFVLLRHSSNAGVVSTFEEALRNASGDILFLCDEDDLWTPDKVRKVLDVFAAQPETKVVSTAVSLIDERDNPLVDQSYLRHRQFTPNLFANLLHNQYQGSAMAFRASVLPEVLPFPKQKLFLHDAWIGTRNTLSGGRTVYLEEPLVLYRRHSGNFSRRLNRWKQLQLRVQFVVANLWRLLQRSTV